jgi:hypothetical protein
MDYTVRIEGTSPIIFHNGAAGLEPRSPENLRKKEITAKKGNNRTEQDDAELDRLECLTSLYFDGEGRVAPPSTMIRACVEKAARKNKQGPNVREGLVMASPYMDFEYDVEKYGTTPEELSESTQFKTGVVVQRSRILRTRAMFELPWSMTFQLDCDPELVDDILLEGWLDIAGRRIGLGDWRPEKSGAYGRFAVADIQSST